MKCTSYTIADGQIKVQLHLLAVSVKGKNRRTAEGLAGWGH